jgi:hypothetical protein
VVQHNNFILEMIAESNTLRQGYLTKEGHFIKNWKRRFFCLGPTAITYYPDESMKVRKGVYALDTSCKIVKEDAIKGRMFCFSISADGGSRYLLMQAESERDMDAWILSIKGVIDPRPISGAPQSLSKVFADVAVIEDEPEIVQEVVQEAVQEKTDTPPAVVATATEDETKTTNYDLENFTAEGWVLKREGETGIYHNRYVWINSDEKTLHWSKDEDKFGPSKSIPLAGCSLSEVKVAKQQRRASFVGTADTPGFSFSVIIPEDSGVAHPILGLKVTNMA